MRKTFSLFLLALFISAGSFAQYYTPQNRVWAFGYGGGVDFNSGSPVPFTSSMASNEGCASICDPTGNLLFYTNGRVVYNRTGATMPGGSSIVSFNTNSTSQGAIIVPVLSNANQYYIFSLEEASYSIPHCHLAYSIVDMTLDGGMGDVLSTARGIILDTFLSEHMTAVSGDGCNVWLVTHKRLNMDFVARSITTAGINPPVTSTAGTYTGTYLNIYGDMVASPDRRHIAMAVESSMPNGLELYDFNPLTGVVSNRQVLDSINNCYGIEFSPDNSKLYTVRDGVGSSGTIVDQYEVSLPTTAAIISSRNTVYYGGIATLSALRLGPDGRIYLNRLSDMTSSYLDVITDPNLSGPTCGYVPHAVTLSTGTHGFLGLPAMVAGPGYGIATFTSHDTFACIAPGDSVNLHSHDTGSIHMWYDGRTGPMHTVRAYGSYWVIEGSGCAATIDTITVHPDIRDTQYAAHDTFICIHGDLDTAVLSLPPGAIDPYWYDGDTASIKTIMGSGTYWRTYVLNCTRYYDTLSVHFTPYPDQVLGPDSVCTGSSVTFVAYPPGGTWSTGNISIATVGSASGIVTGMSAGIAAISYATQAGCKGSKNITVLPLPCITAVGDLVKNEDVSVYPNPAYSEFIVSVGAPFARGRIAIHDVTGKLMLAQELTRSQTGLPVTDLPAGVYECRIAIYGYGQVLKKLVVMR